MLDEPPRFIHDAEFQGRSFGRILDAGGDAVQEIEQERLKQRGIRAYRLEVEHLQSLNGEGVLTIVEQTRVPAAFNPLVQSSCERARKKIGDGEQPALGLVEHVEVFDCVVHLAVFRFTQPIPVLTFEQHADERVEKMQMLRRRR